MKGRFFAMSLPKSKRKKIKQKMSHDMRFNKTYFREFLNLNCQFFHFMDFNCDLQFGPPKRKETEIG